MKRLSLTSVYLYGLMAVLFGVVLHAPFSVMAGVATPEWTELFKAWKEIALVLIALIASIVLTRQKLWGRIIADWLVRLALLYVALHLVLAVVLPGELRSVVAGLMIDLRFIAFFLLAYGVTFVRPDAVDKLLKTVALGAAVVLGFGLLQITVLPDDVLTPLGYSNETIRPFTTIDRNPDFVRINSTLRGPNPLGAICVVYGALALAYLLHRWRSLSVRRRVELSSVLVISAAVLFASYSRSAYAAFLLMAFVTLAVTWWKVISPRVVIAGVGATLIAGTGLLLLQTTDWYSNVILHEDPESTVVTKSNQEHFNSLAYGVSRAINQPVGAGIGSTGSASMYDADQSNDVIIENYYLFVAHESGWLGLAIFLGLNAWVLARLWALRASWTALALFASGLGLVAIGLLLPVWADETVALTWWGLAGGILGNGYAKRTRQ